MRRRNRKRRITKSIVGYTTPRRDLQVFGGDAWVRGAWGGPQEGAQWAAAQNTKALPPDWRGLGRGGASWLVLIVRQRQFSRRD